MIHEALFLKPSLALCQVAGYTHKGRIYYRTGEARSYDHPTKHRGLVAIFMSASGRMSEILPDRHFPKDQDLLDHLSICKPWLYKLVGFVELLGVYKYGDMDYSRVFSASWNDYDLEGQTLVYETRPVVGSLTNPEEAPRFDEVCTECCRLKDSAELKNHRLSKHTRWQRVELPERFCPCPT